jgi:hypothetical protein
MLVITATQKAALAIAAVDAKGNPAPVEGAPSWSSSEPTLVTVEPSEDGLSAVIKAVGPVTPTPVQINVMADADLGEGVRAITGLLEVSVIAGEAVGVAISAGSPEEQ